MSLPIEIHLARPTAEALADSEDARNDDYWVALAEFEAGELAEAPDRCFAFEVATEAVEASPAKFVTLKVTTQAQADDVYYAVCSGTFKISFLNAARRIADALRAFVDPELVSVWPEPHGG